MKEIYIWTVTVCNNIFYTGTQIQVLVRFLFHVLLFDVEALTFVFVTCSIDVQIFNITVFWIPYFHTNGIPYHLNTILIFKHILLNLISMSCIG